MQICCASVLRWPCFRQHGVLATDQPAMQAIRRRVHCVLLIVQPLECADDAGFTLVQSHCCTLHSGPVRLSCSPSYFYTPYFCKVCPLCKVPRDHTSIIKYSDAEVRPHLKLMNNNFACAVLTHISHKFSQVQAERKSSQMKKKKRGRGRRDI